MSNDAKTRHRGQEQIDMSPTPQERRGFRHRRPRTKRRPAERCRRGRPRFFTETNSSERLPAGADFEISRRDGSRQSNRPVSDQRTLDDLQVYGQAVLQSENFTLDTRRRKDATESILNQVSKSERRDARMLPSARRRSQQSGARHAQQFDSLAPAPRRKSPADDNGRRRHTSSSPRSRLRRDGGESRPRRPTRTRRTQQVALAKVELLLRARCSGSELQIVNR